MEADSPKPEIRTIASAAKTGGVVGLLFGLPLTALLLKLKEEPATPVRILVLWPIVVGIIAVGFAVRAYVMIDPPLRRWISISADQKRLWLAWSLMLLSPLAFAVVSTSILGIERRLFFGSTSTVVAYSLALMASAPAAILPAVGSLLLPLRLPYRIAIGVLFAFVGFIVYWVALAILTAIAGFPVVRFEA